MTFDQALEQKQKIGNKVEKNGCEFVVIVAPANQENFKKFVSDFRTNNFNTDTAKAYSTDRKFIVCGLWTDGSSVAYIKDL